MYVYTYFKYIPEYNTHALEILIEYIYVSFPKNVLRLRVYLYIYRLNYLKLFKFSKTYLVRNTSPKV